MNKSEELAKLLGIEPIYKISWYVIGKPKIKKIDIFSNKDVIIKMQNDNELYNVHQEIEIYTDFTKPSNFIKLLEMETGIAKYSLWWEINRNSQDSCVNPTNRQEFISAVIEYMEEYPNQNLTVKQSAQKIEWEY